MQCVKASGDDEKGALEDLLPIGLYLQQIKTVVQCTDNQSSDQRSSNAADASFEAGSANDNGSHAVKFCAVADQWLARI